MHCTLNEYVSRRERKNSVCAAHVSSKRENGMVVWYRQEILNILIATNNNYMCNNNKDHKKFNGRVKMREGDVQLASKPELVATLKIISLACVFHEGLKVLYVRETSLPVLHQGFSQWLITSSHYISVVARRVALSTFNKKGDIHFSIVSSFSQHNIISFALG